MGLDNPLHIAFLVVILLLVFLFGWWLAHSGASHRAPAPANPVPTVEFVK